MAPTRDPAAPILLVGLEAVTHSTVTLTANFTAPALYSGRIYCAAFSSGTNVTSTGMIVTSGASVTYLAGAVEVVVTISKLSAVEDYDTYCAAVTVNGAISRYLDVLSTKLFVQTRPFKEVTFTTSHTYVYGDVTRYAASSVPVFSYALSSSPRVNVTFAHILRNASGLVVPSSVLTVLPAFVTFYRSGALVGNFILSGGALLEGEFTIELRATGANANDYESGVSTTTTVLSATSTPPVPALLSAKFANSGASIAVTFDSNTDRAAITQSGFSCFQLFEFTGVNTTSCTWTSATRVNIVFNAVPYGTQLVRVDDFVTLKSGLVKAACIAPADCSLYGTARASVGAGAHCRRSRGTHRGGAGTWSGEHL